MKRNALIKALVVATALASLPAAAAQDPSFMREMARTDGNPLGDYAIPTLSDYTLSKIEKAKLDTFIAELSRTDGAAVPVEHTASDTTVARR